MRKDIAILVICLSSFPTYAQRAGIPRSPDTYAATAQDSPMRERPVFMTAQRLALLCSDWLKIPVGYMDDASYSVSPQQFARAMGCISYVEGVSDTLLDDAGNNAPYKPKTGQLSDARAAIGYFVKYMDRNAVDNDLAAVTVLRQCEMERSRTR